MTKRFIAFAALCLIAGCQSPSPALITPPPAVHAITLSKEEMSKIEAAVRSELRDPASALVEDVGAAQNQYGLTTVCGFVNVKNGYDGSTGRRPFEGMIPRGKLFSLSKISTAPMEMSASFRDCLTANGKPLPTLH